MEHDFFHFDFEPSEEAVEAIIETMSGLFKAAGVKIQSVDSDFDEDDKVLNNVSFHTQEKAYRFTYDDSGSPCVDVCDLEGNVYVTLRPSDYDELIQSI